MIENIKKNLASVRAKIEELRTSKTDLESEVSELETQFIDGKADHSKIQSKRSVLLSITESLRSMISRETQLQGDLDAAVDTNEQESRRRSMIDAGKRASKAVAEYDELLSTASSQIEAIGRQLAAKRIEIGTARKDFFDLSREGDVAGVNAALSRDELRTVTESKIRHRDIGLHVEVKAVESAMLSRIERENRTALAAKA